MNKKGMDISLNFIILAVLGLIALILIALFFTGGLSNLFKQTEDVGSTSAEQVALYKTKCNFYCTTDDEGSWTNPDFPADLGVKDCSEFDLGKVWYKESSGDIKCEDNAYIPKTGETAYSA